MAINSTITTDGKVHANIDGFTGVMYLEDLEAHTPFASINFPPTTADALQTVNVSQRLEITNMEALTTFNTWLLTKDEVRITTYGETHVRVKGIARSYPVTFKKTITTPGEFLPCRFCGRYWKLTIRQVSVDSMVRLFLTPPSPFSPTAAATTSRVSPTFPTTPSSLSKL